MTENLLIEWYGGYAMIVLKEFFPAPKVRINKLLKMNIMSNEADQNIEFILNYIEQRIPELESEFAQLKQDYPIKHTEMCRLAEIVKTKKLPSGVRVSDVDLHDYKYSYGVIKKAVQDMEKAAKENRKAVKGLKENLEYIKVRCSL